MELKYLLLESDDGITTLTINRPKALNALNSSVLAACAVEMHSRLTIVIVGYVIRNFRELIGKHELRGAKKKSVTSAITYFENNRQHMRYDEYLAAGYPIGSGVAQGACHHVVKDRMEGAGMRWEL